MIHIVTLERNPIREMSAFEDAIRQGCRYLLPVMRNVWLVNTVESPPQLFERLRHHMRKADNLLIIRVQNQYSGWLTKTSWDWLRTSASNGDFEEVEEVAVILGEQSPTSPAKDAALTLTLDLDTVAGVSAGGAEEEQ